MRMRLKYVIGGALVSLATLMAAGGANALVITEQNAAGMGIEGPATVVAAVASGLMWARR